MLNPIHLLTRIRDACLFDDDDGGIGVTQDPSIDSKLFDDICYYINQHSGKEEPHLEPLGIYYTNYRGETSWRNIIPLNTYWGVNEYHPTPQWLLFAFDRDKQDYRVFAMKDFSGPELFRRDWRKDSE